MARISKEEQAKNVAYWEIIRQAAEAIKTIAEYQKWSMLQEYWSAEVRDEGSEFTRGPIREPSSYPSHVKHAKSVEASFMVSLYDVAAARNLLREIFKSEAFEQVNSGSEITDTEAFSKEIGVPEWEYDNTFRKMPKMKKFEASCVDAISNAKGLARYARKQIRKKAKPVVLQEACISAYAKRHHW